MKEIDLTQGKVALVDDEDYTYLIQWNWFATKQPCTYYAKRSVTHPRSGAVWMHREILEYHGIEINNLDTDHINGDGLDNRKENLRVATRLENSRNRRKHPCKVNSSHPYKGITAVNGRYWSARIRINGDRIYLGCFSTPEEASKSYEEAAKKYFGEFARLNDSPPVHASSNIPQSTDTKYTYKKHKDARSIYKGVYPRPHSSLWQAELYFEGKHIYCGNYSTQEDAARAYNKAALAYLGERAKLNKICDSEKNGTKQPT